MASINTVLIKVTRSENTMEIMHICGSLHAKMYYAGDRGPSVLFYMGVFNWTTTAIEKDVFGQVILDVDAFQRLSIEMTNVCKDYPVVRDFIPCNLTHNGQRSAMACNLCNPLGLRFFWTVFISRKRCKFKIYVVPKYN